MQLAYYYDAAASAFHEIFYNKLPENFSRNYSGKVPLFFRKFPEKFRRKFPEISELTTLPSIHQRHGRADGRLTIAIPRLHYVHRAAKSTESWAFSSR